MPSSDIINDLKIVLDITSRVDERVKVIKDAQQDLFDKIDAICEDIKNMESRISVIESSNNTDKHNKLLAELHLLDKRETQSAMQVKIELESIKLIIQALEKEKNSWLRIINSALGLLVHGMWVILVSYLLFKLGISNPPIP